MTIVKTIRKSVASKNRVHLNFEPRKLQSEICGKPELPALFNLRLRLRLKLKLKLRLNQILNHKSNCGPVRVSGTHTAEK